MERRHVAKRMAWAVGWRDVSGDSGMGEFLGPVGWWTSWRTVGECLGTGAGAGSPDGGLRLRPTVMGSMA